MINSIEIAKIKTKDQYIHSITEYSSLKKVDERIIGYNMKLINLDYKPHR